MRRGGDERGAQESRATRAAQNKPDKRVEVPLRRTERERVANRRHERVESMRAVKRCQWSR